MLNAKMELEDFQPINLEKIQQTENLSESTIEAINLFNRALDDMQCRNEDIAIISLKKAISLHPDFYEAMNLLGLCYLAVGKEEQGRLAFQQVIEADDSSIKALQYLNKLDGVNEQSEENANISKKRKENNQKAVNQKGLFGKWLAKGLQSEDNSLYGLKYIVGILIGALIVGVVWYMVPTNKSLMSFERVENIIKDPELENQIDQLNERIAKLEQELKDRKEENLKLMDSFQVYKDWVYRLDQAESEYSEGNYIQSADLLTNRHGTTIPDDLVKRHQEIWDRVRIMAAEQLYQEGNRIYNENTQGDSTVYGQAYNKYEEAIAFLEQDTVSYLAALYYQAGKSAARSDELDKAVELFETITRDFPGSSYSSYANARLREIADGRPITGI